MLELSYYTSDKTLLPRLIETWAKRNSGTVTKEQARQITREDVDYERGLIREFDDVMDYHESRDRKPVYTIVVAKCTKSAQSYKELNAIVAILNAFETRLAESLEILKDYAPEKDLRKFAQERHEIIGTLDRLYGSDID